MFARIIATLCALLLAAGAFCGAGVEPGGINLSGVAFLFLAIVLWFEWGGIREGYSYLAELRGRGEDNPDLLLGRSGPLTVRDLVAKRRSRKK